MFIKVKNANDETQEPYINIDQITTVFGNLVSVSNGLMLELDDESIKRIMSIIAPKERAAKSNEPKSELLELFEKLHKLTGGKGKATLTLGREKKLKELLTKHRLTPELLIKAATNIGKDDFLQGRDPRNEGKVRYGNIDYLLRPDKAAKWSEDQTDKKKGMF